MKRSVCLATGLLVASATCPVAAARTKTGLVVVSLIRSESCSGSGSAESVVSRSAHRRISATLATSSGQRQTVTLEPAEAQYLGCVSYPGQPDTHWHVVRVRYLD